MEENVLYLPTCIVESKKILKITLSRPLLPVVFRPLSSIQNFIRAYVCHHSYSMQLRAHEDVRHIFTELHSAKTCMVKTAQKSAKKFAVHIHGLQLSYTIGTDKLRRVTSIRVPQ